MRLPRRLVVHGPAMRQLVLVACVLVLVSCARDDRPAASSATAPAATTDSEPFARFDNLTGLRVLPPRWLRSDRAVIVVEAGPDLAGTGAVREARLTITPPGLPPVAATVRLEPVERRTKAGVVVRWRGEAAIDAGTWPDGVGEVRCAADGGASASAGFRVVRAAVAALIADRDEVVAWIDEANRMQPIWGKLPTWSGLNTALRQPAAPFAGLRGMVLRAYRSEHLDRWQPYTVQVPATLDLGSPAPLLILLHGSGGDFRNIISDAANGQRFTDHPMLIANAGAFHYREYRSLALQDVIAIIDDMCAKYPVDRERIYVQGISLGGRGTLESAALMPDRFAAVSTQGTYGITDCLADPAAISRIDPVALGLAARTDMRTWLPNLRNTPVEAIVGLNDDTTPPYNGMIFAHLVRELGGEGVVRTFPRGHDISMPDYDWGTTRAWMLSHRRNTTPDEVYHRVSCLRYGRNAWTRIQALDDYAGIGEVHARLVAKGSATAAVIETVNVAALDLAPHQPVAQVAFVRDGATRTVLPMPADGRLHVVIGADGSATAAQPAAQPATDPQRKRPGRSGPLWDAWSDPVLYVHDAVPGPASERLRLAAEDSATWDLTAGATRLALAASDALTPEQRQRRNLIVFTEDPSACPLLAGIDLPAQLATQPGAVTILLRPAPWSPDRSVVIVVHRADRPVSLHEFGIWDECLHGDWVTARPLPLRKPRYAGQKPNPHPGVQPLAAGVFDATWRPAASTTGTFTGDALLGPGAH
jgi:predicted esterase